MRLPLIVILAISAVLELSINRIGMHLIGSYYPPEGGGTVPHVLETSGIFLSHFTACLALSMAVWSTVVFIRDKHLMRPPERILLTIFSAAFFPVAFLGIINALPPITEPCLNLAFGWLILILLISFIRSPAPLRAKFGVFYLTLPILLHCYWLFTQQVPAMAPGGSYSEIPSQLFETGEHLIVAGAFTTFLFFAPFPKRVNIFSFFPLTTATLTTVGAAYLLKFQYPIAAQAAYYGLGITLSPLFLHSIHSLLLLLGLFLFSWTLISLILQPNHNSQIALGLILIAVSGFHLQLPYHFLLTLVGFIQIIRSSPHPLCSIPTFNESYSPTNHTFSTSLNNYLLRLASHCSRPPADGEIMTLQTNGRQLYQARGQRDGATFLLRLFFYNNRPESFEATIGAPPAESPAISILRRGESSHHLMYSRLNGTKKKLGIKEFDQQFVLQDSTDISLQWLSEHQMLTALLRHIHGWLGLWPGEGVQYQAKLRDDGWPIPIAEAAFSSDLAGTEEIEQIVTVLISCAKQINVPFSVVKL